MYRIYKSFLGRYWLIIVLLLVLQTAQTLATLYLPTLNADIINEGIVKGDIDYIWHTGTFMLIITGGQVFLSIIAIIVGSRVAMRLGRNIRRVFYKKVQDFSEVEMSQFGPATLITRSTNDILQVQNFTMFLLNIIISAPIMLIGGIVLSISLNLQMSTIIAAVLPIFILVIAVLAKYLVPKFNLFQKQTDNINGIMRDQITGIRPIRAFVREITEIERFDKVNNRLYDLNISVGRGMTLVFPLVFSLINLTNLAITFFGAYAINSGNMPIGDLTAFINYTLYILMSIMMSTMMFIMFPRAQVCAVRINQVLQTPITIRNPENPVKLTSPKGIVEFKNTSFRYKGAEKSVIDRISFIAKPGEITAIIGSTGAGKTTLLNLINRLFDATSGEICFDGVNIKQLDLAKLNNYISYIPQKAYLFSGTVKSNLLFGDDKADDNKLVEALKTAQAYDFVYNEANGLDSEVAQGGTNFSGGQRQRLAIARALVKQSKVILFDDSFSALDYTTDMKLRRDLRPITKDKTVIIVAQRVSTIRNANQILVLDKGEIVSSGTHTQLLQKCQTYREIVRSQERLEENNG
ncbi:MAG: ABC transporter ATP-binding protein/permease [Bifidobacteriaceae bacterium]|nr:ABC transporter ATP-binding protein/permease [Bifidobacteriaceae bacterium]